LLDTQEPPTPATLSSARSPGLEPHGGVRGSVPPRLALQLARALADQLELGPLLALALRELSCAMPTHAAAVWLAEPGDAVTFLLAHAVAGEHADGLPLESGQRLALEASGFGPCLEEGRDVYALRHPLEASPVGLARHLERWGALSAVAVPLRCEGRTVGVLLSASRCRPDFADEQVQWLHGLADLLGPAIHNHQCLDRLRAAYEDLCARQREEMQAEKQRILAALAGGMAHHFNNSLCGVLGYLQLALQDTTLTPATHGYLHSARTCALDAAGVMRRIQEFARQERHALSPRLLDVNHLVRQTVEQQRTAWEEISRPLALDVRLDSAGWVRGCAGELREALTNLTRNAVQAMPHGGTLGLRTWSDAAHVHLAVSDTGVGMSPEVRQRLFEPFFTTRGDGRSKGLGLSVVYGVVRRHEGEITVASEPGQGARFLVRLPVASVYEP
jgi:signal transduction histidine kinase